MHRQTDRWRAEGKKVGLVPTMGALHRGHMSLVETAIRECDVVVVSIFVNPSQFGEGEDFHSYPRDLKSDLALLAEVDGVSAVFAPLVDEMYPPGGVSAIVRVDDLTKTLCGPHRPGHFTGVATIVTRLLTICKPHLAFFGLKDIQQFTIIRKLVTDLNIDVEIVGVPIVREVDGLALSSRNVYLSEEERRQAVVISMGLQLATDKLRRGETDTVVVEDTMREVIATAPLADVQYAEVVDSVNLTRKRVLEEGQKVIAAVAVYFGKTRLIDNIVVDVGQ